MRLCILYINAHTYNGPKFTINIIYYKYNQVWHKMHVHIIMKFVRT